jgi:phage terminase small subunit
MDMNELCPRHQEFLREYLISFNAADAYRRVYPKSKNPDINGHKLLRIPKIKAAIEKARLRRQEQFEITEKSLIEEVGAIAFGHLGRVANWDGDSMTAIPKEELAERDMKFLDSIEKITLGPGMTKVTVKTLANQKLKAIDMLGKHFGWLGHGEKGSDPGDKQALLKRLSESVRRIKQRGGKI